MQTIIFFVLLVLYVMVGCRLLQRVNGRAPRITLTIVLVAGLLFMGTAALLVTNAVIAVVSFALKAVVICVIAAAIIGAFTS